MPAARTDPEVPAYSVVNHSGDERVLVWGLWSDGRVVWSEDALWGGPPYHRARLDPQLRTDALNRLHQLFERLGETRVTHRRPPASYVELIHHDGPRTRRLESWHEIFERNRELVVTDSGIEVLGGRTRSETLASCPASYRHFRNVWSDIRAMLRGLTPPAGVAVEPGEAFQLPPE